MFYHFRLLNGRALTSGNFFCSKCAEESLRPHARKDNDAEKLWELSEEWAKPKEDSNAEQTAASWNAIVASNSPNERSYLFFISDFTAIFYEYRT